MERDELPVDDALIVALALSVVALPSVVTLKSRGLQWALVGVVEQVHLVDVGVDLGLFFWCPAGVVGDPQIEHFPYRDEP